MPREYITDILTARGNTVEWLDQEIPAHQKKLGNYMAMANQDVEQKDISGKADKMSPTDADTIDKAIVTSMKDKMFKLSKAMDYDKPPS